MGRAADPGHVTRSLISARQLFTGLQFDVNMGVEIVKGRVISTAKHHNFNFGADTIVLPKGAVLTAGLIDIQVNGGGGVLLNDAPTLKTIETMVAAHRRFGTTGMLPTLITDTPDKMGALFAIAQQALKIPGVLGFHLEGPFINPARKGAHREDLIRRPTDVDIAQLKRFGALGRSRVDPLGRSHRCNLRANAGGSRGGRARCHASI
jgi:N-acetylglucosamine-6-phosphate deacetylase